MLLMFYRVLRLTSSLQVSSFLRADSLDSNQLTIIAKSHSSLK